MLVKFASAAVLGATLQRGSALVRDAHRHSFTYEPRVGFLYVRSRAISSRTNDNYDNFPAAEIKEAYQTFIGKPVFVNHHNEDHRRARGVVVDAALHEDTNPDGSEDTWVEVLMEVDAVRFPKLAQAILAGEIDRTSMGTDVEYSICSVCSNKAHTPLEYCFPPGELVTMADGTLRPIEDVREGESVLTHDGPGVVSATMEREYDGPLALVFRRGYAAPLRVTHGHEVLANLPGRRDESKSGADRYASVHDADNWRWTPIEQVDEGNWLQGAYPTEQVRQVYSIADLAEDFSQRDERVTLDGAKNSLPATLANDDEAFAFIVGLYLAEGSLEAARTQLGTPKCISWSLGAHETDLVHRLQLALDKLDAGSLHTYPRGGGVQVRLSNAPLAVLLDSLCGSGAKAKHLHGSVMTAPHSFQRVMLDAYFEGDGWDDPRGHVEVRSASGLLSRQLVMLGARLDSTVPSWWRNQNNRGGPTRRDVFHVIHHVGMGRDGSMKGRRNLTPGYYAAQVVDVQIEDYRGPVYNIEVEGQNSYVAEGVVVHNCAHIPKLKGMKVQRTTASGKKEEVLVYEKCLAEGSSVTTRRGLVPIEDVTPDDMVLTRKGWRQVIHVTFMGIKETVRVELEDGRSLVCTPDHRIATDRGWVEALALLPSADSRSTALSTVTSFPSIGLDVDAGVLVGVGVSAGAVGAEVHSVVPSMDRRVDGVEMVRSDTGSDSTSVIDLQAIKVYALKPQYGSVDQLLSVGATVDHPVAVSRSDGSLPDEAISVRDGAGEQVFQLLGVRGVTHNVTVPVYDLGVEGEHEFVADGVVVHNCYGLRFFENSLLVEEPADPTALTLGVEDYSGVDWSSHMSPRSAKLDLSDDGGRDSKSVSDLRQGELSTSASSRRRQGDQFPFDDPDIGLGEFAGGVVNARRTASFDNHVGGVRGRGAEEPVGRVVAQGHVAGVADEHPWRNGSNEMGVSPTVRPGARASRIRSGESSVSVAEDPSRPRPARIRPTAGVNLRPVPFDFRHGEHGSHSADHGAYFLASRKQGVGEIMAPPQVDTLRDEACPICGEADTFDGDRCLVCQYVRPPEEFLDPDLEKAQQIDLRQDEESVPIGEEGLEGEVESDFTDLSPEDVAEVAPEFQDAVTEEMENPDPEDEDYEGEDPEGESDIAPEFLDDPDTDTDEDEDSEDDESEDEDEDGEDDDTPPFFKKKKSRRNSVRERNSGGAMRPALAALAAQHKTIVRQGAQIKALTEGVKFIAKLAGVEKHPQVVAIFRAVAADEENPAQPYGWANPGPNGEEAPAATSAETLGDVSNDVEGGGATDDVEAIGNTSESDVSPGAQTSVDSTETVLDEPLDLNEQDVTAPVAGTDDLGLGAPGQAGSGRTETEVRIGDPNNPDAAFTETGWTAKKETGEGRTYASLRLARLRIQAGIAKTDDDLALGTSIASSDVTDAAIQSEIDTLAQVVKVTGGNAPRPRVARNLVPRAASGVERVSPSFQDTSAPAMSVVGSVSEDEFAFE